MRSGSTTLLTSLHQNLKYYKSFCEPFNSIEGFGDLKSQYSLNYNNLLVKILPWDLLYATKSSFSFINDLFIYNVLNINDLKPYIILQLKEYSLNFDQVILLSRKNYQAAAESSIYASNVLEDFHTPYEYTSQKGYNKALNAVKNQIDIINQLSQVIKIPITYYEDLYKGDKTYIQHFLDKNNIKINNFDLFAKALDPKNKYRKN